VSAGCQNDSIGQVDRSLARLQVKRHRPKANPIVDEQARDILVFVDFDTKFGCLVSQGKQHGAPGMIAGVTGAAVCMRAEKPLVKSAVWQAGKRTTPFSQLHDSLRCFLG
jgi:hypothetical protein